MVLLLQFAALMRLDAMAPAVLILAAVAWLRRSGQWRASATCVVKERLRFIAFITAGWKVGQRCCCWRWYGDGPDAAARLLPLLAFVVLLALGAAVLVAEWLGRRLGNGRPYGASLMVTETLVLLLMAVLLPGMTAAA